MNRKFLNNIFIGTIVLSFAISIYLLFYINRNVLPMFSKYVKSNVYNRFSYMISNCVNDNIDSVDLDKLVVVSKDSFGNIVSIDYNTIIVNDILVKINKRILNDIRKLESNDGFIYKVPLGSVSHNIFIGNLGSKIPVRFKVIGNVISNIKTRVKSYGINNALLEIYVNVSIDGEVIIPFNFNKIVLNTEVPISIRLVQGSIPKYYNGNLFKESGLLSIPK